MKMIVSDYDNTFYIDDSDIKNNVELVNKFMKNNIFTIATGRSYLDFKEVKDKYNINCNYLIINNGATILKNDEVIYNITMDNSIKNELINDLKLDHTIMSFACFEKESRIDIKSDNITKIHVRYKNKEESQKIKNTITQKYSKYVNTFYVWNNEGFEVVSKEADKSNAINFIANIEKIDKNKIYTIGDSDNDIEMIKKFNGSAITNSVDELNNFKKYDSVSNLIKEVMSNNESIKEHEKENSNN